MIEYFLSQTVKLKAVSFSNDNHLQIIIFFSKTCPSNPSPTCYFNIAGFNTSKVKGVSKLVK